MPIFLVAWDGWTREERYPDEVYVFASKTHMTLSRIDLMICNEEALSRMGDISYLPQGKLDHTTQQRH